MKREIIYIVQVGYYEFKFYNFRNALSFAQEAMQSNLEKGGLPIRIELQWEEPEEEEEPEEADTEDVIDIDSLNLDGGDTE
jgi:hypothetical protein